MIASSNGLCHVSGVYTIPLQDPISPLTASVSESSGGPWLLRNFILGPENDLSRIAYDQFDRGEYNPLVLFGSTATGKTTLAHFVARHRGYKPLEVNASDDRSAEVLKEHILRAMETTLDFSGKAQPNCLILDEVDGAEQALSALLPLIRADSQQKQYLRRPIIFICNNAYAVRSLMPCARHFYVKPPSAGRLVMRLQGILRSEEKPVQAPLLHALVASTAGDVRSCLHTLQFAAASGDLNASLKEMLEGGKDARNHVPGVVQGVFRRDKKGRRTVDGVLNMVEVS